MVKKITLDFSKVEERSGWNSKEMPEGLHEFKIELVDHKDANDGTAMTTYGLRPTNPKYKTRLFPYYCKHQANQYFKLRDIFVAAGIPVPKKKQSLDLDAPVGKIIAAEVRDATGQFAGRSEIDGVYDRSIIEDDDQEGVDDEDEVDEDDIDDEADEVEDDEEVEEGDEDELREELEALTLPALRKRAKELEIDTAGVKAPELIELIIEEELGEIEDEEADEEDDLDDEDLADEDLEDEEFDDEEDEEEEPEPAPRRRAAPAKKAPAKKSAPAAKAAPARRVVKRR